ncbi:MAG: branched-chain amino acid ABC transporter permease [Pseudomonadota bacterium]
MISQMHHPLSRTTGIVLLVALLAFPLLANHFGQEFYVGMVSRLMIFALAATSLNLLLGFGGMVSMGHAAYLGAGAYTVGILMHHGVLSAWVSWPVAVLVGAVLAFLIGLVSLRTKGVYFIMITLAFAQMIYFIFVGLKEYGGEDGLSMRQRSDTGLLDLSVDINFYYVVLALTAISMYLVYRLVNSHFGRVLQAVKQNEVRMEAIGYSVVRYKLVCFVITGALASLAGALLANQNMMVSPSLVHWTQSGSLMVMVILGGTGFFFGGAIGAVVMLMLEEVLSAYTIHWQIIVGAVLLGVVLLLPHGLASLFQRKRGDNA